MSCHEEEECSFDDDDDDAGCNWEKIIQKQWNILNVFCQRLMQNDIKTYGDSLDNPLCLRSETFVRTFAEHLHDNTSLRELHVAIWPAYEMSSTAFATLTQAIQNSSITSFSLQEKPDPWDEEFEPMYTGNVFRRLCPASMLRNLCRLRIDIVLNDDDMETLGLALCNNQKLEELVIRIESVSTEGANDLFQGLEQSSVSHLSLEDASNKVCHLLFAKGILYLPKLRSLCIDHNQHFYYKWRGTKDEAAVVKGKRDAGSQLESFKLELSNINVPDLNLIASAFQGSHSLKELDMGLNMVEEDCGKGIPHLLEICKVATHLETLNFHPNYMSPKEMEKVLHMASMHPTLKALTLHCEDRDFDCTRPSPKHDLSYNGRDFPRAFRNWSAAILVKYLKSSDFHLEKAHVSFQYLALSGLHQLIMASSSSCLKELNVRSCDVICPKWLTLIANALEGSKLSVLDVMSRPPSIDNSTSKEAKVKEQAAWKAAAQLLVEAVKNNVCLCELRLYTTDTLLAVHHEIQFYLHLNKFGRQFFRLQDDEQCQQQRVPLGLWAHVMNKHRNDSGSLFYFLREQPWLLVRPGKADAREATNTKSAAKKRKLDVC